MGACGGRAGPHGEVAMPHPHPLANPHQNRPAFNLFCTRTRCRHFLGPTLFGGYVREGSTEQTSE